jgi:hypothetical protein
MIDKKLLTSILGSTYFAAGEALALPALRRELERTHNIVANAAELRGAIALLASAGLLIEREDRIILTERGQDVAALRAPLPELV